MYAFEKTMYTDWKGLDWTGFSGLSNMGRLYTVVGGPEMTLFSRPHGCMHVMAKSKHLIAFGS